MHSIQVSAQTGGLITAGCSVLFAVLSALWARHSLRLQQITARLMRGADEFEIENSSPHRFVRVFGTVFLAVVSFICLVVGIGEAITH